LRGDRKRPISPIVARNVVAQITLTPGTVISLRACPEASAVCAISRSTAAILGVKERDLA
jgi:hypothetical protein